MNRTCKLLLIPVALFLLFFFLFVARHRFIDGDEGKYLLAARLVLEHKVPYLDFFHNQTPLLPYAYGLWMKLFGISWFSARGFAAVLTAALGLLVYEDVCLGTRRWVAGLAAVALYVSCTWIFAWFPVAKTFSLAALPLFGAYMIVARLQPLSQAWLAAAAGLLFGLSVETRSYVAALAPIFLWWIFRHAETRRGIAAVLWFVGGFSVAMLPSLYLFATSPDHFLFNNVRFNVMLNGTGATGGWRLKIRILRDILLSPEGVQLSLLLAIPLAAILVSRARRSATLLASMLGLAVAFISVLPRPSFTQNLSLCAPFLIVAAVGAASKYLSSLRGRWPKQAAALGCAALLAIFVASSLAGFRRYFVTGDQVSTLYHARDAQYWTLDAVTKVSRAIDQLAAPHEQIAAFWPGYIFASEADPYPGFESNFLGKVPMQLTAEQRARYHMISGSDIAAIFAAHTPRIVVSGQRNYCGDPPHISRCAKLLLSDGYVATRTVGQTSIFVAP